MEHIKAQGSINPVPVNGNVKRYAKASMDDKEKFKKAIEKAEWVEEEEEEDDEGDKSSEK